MSYQFPCPTCESIVTVPDGTGGLGGDCRKCGNAYTVPRASDSWNGRPARPQARPAPLPELAGAKILLVDDDHFVKLFLQATLKQLGASVVVANNAATAIRLARLEKPSLIILDLAMPMTGGMEILPDLIGCNNDVETPVIIVTASDPAVSKAPAMRAGAAAFVQKPVDPRTMVETILAVLTRSPSAASAL